jgi:Tol biopolymer transport system component/DNA-binding winged helix-turn-helix (wHTH) protein
MSIRFEPQVRWTFGPFELNAAAGELRKKGIHVRLSGQPLQILVLLLTHSGEVVSRERLREHIWGDGISVDFEGGLNAAMAKLRRALGDSAENPRYIETLPGRGYRFLAAVDSVARENRANAVAEDRSEPQTTGALVDLPRRGGLSFWQWFAVAFTGLMLSSGAWWLSSFKASSPDSWRLSPLTPSASLEDWPSLSPDGKLVVYSADPDFAGKVDLYLRHVAGGAAIRLTKDGEGNRMPDFSPDGSRIVFRSDRNGGGIYQMPVLGGEVQLVVQGGLNPKFSPDGQQVAYWMGSATVAVTVPGSGSVWVVPARGGQARRIGHNLSSARNPVWWPDGKSVLVVGYNSTKTFDPSSIDWWLCSTDGERLTRMGLYEELQQRGIHPSETIQSRLRTPVPSIAAPGCWTPKHDAVITTLESGENENLWAVGVSPTTGRVTGEVTRLTKGAANEWNPSCSRAGTIAFTNIRTERRIWTLPFDANQAKSEGLLRPIVKNAADHENPAFSADGRYIAFVSNQSGRPNIWRRDLKTGIEIQAAASARVQRYPLISPSGGKIAYSVYESNQRVLYVVGSDNSPEKVCEGCLRATDWSSDEGSILVFGGSPYQIELLNLLSHKRTPAVRHDRYSLLYGRFSPDHRWISFTVRMSSNLAKIAIAPLSRTSPAPQEDWIFIADVALDDYANWSPDGKTVYFSSPKDGNSCLWAQRIDPITGRLVGKEFAIQHLHGQTTFGHGGWMMTAGQIGLALVDTTSNVWTMSQ